MKKNTFLLLALLFSNFLFAQHKFTIELNAPALINDTLIFTPPTVGRGFEDLYRIKLNTNKDISDFGKKFGFEQSAYQIIVRKKNILEGEFDYPRPVSFQFVDSKTHDIYLTSTFFIDSGYSKIELPEMFNFYEIIVNSPANIEYLNFKKLFADLYIKPDEQHRFARLTDLTKKEERIGSYIKKNPDSYVALWEIVDDYVNHRYNHIYLENLQLFSDEIKKSELYIKFENKLRLASSINTGNEFPDIQFDEQNTLTKGDFKKYKLTFIDYWSTTCIPCIKAMPEIVAMYNEYKDRGINFITVTDENEPKRIKLAKGILNKNNVKWANYFDVNKDFKNKVGATMYPLQFLIDQNGKVVSRVEGNLSEVKKVIGNNLK